MNPDGYRGAEVKDDAASESMVNGKAMTNGSVNGVCHSVAVNGNH